MRDLLSDLRLSGLLSTKHLTKDHLHFLFEECVSDNPPASKNRLKGVLGFFEPSTRTKASFWSAGLDVGVEWMDFRADDLSLKKGESYKDTFDVIASYDPDFFVIRDSSTGLPHLVQEWTKKPVINAGDGMNEHPTQALGDALTLFQVFGKKKGRALAFFGDTFRSRVARSNIPLLKAMGWEISSVVEPEDREGELFARAFGIRKISRKQLKQMDVVMALRFQKERGSSVQSGALTPEDLSPKTWLMHPGPVIVNEDIRYDTLQSAAERNLILKQIRNCFLMRRTLLKLLGGRRR